MSNENKAGYITQSKSLLLSLILGLFLSLPVHAVLVSQDDAVWGAGSLTLDTASGLRWLDINLSTGLSYNQMRIEMLSGGQFDGFRYASQGEIETLFINSGVPDINQATAANFAAAQNLMGFLGYTSSSRGNNEILGISGTAQPGGVGSGIVDHFYSSGLPVYDISLIGPTYGKDYSSAVVGSWLVASVEVPLPGAFVFFSTALLALGSIKPYFRRLR